MTALSIAYAAPASGFRLTTNGMGADTSALVKGLFYGGGTTRLLAQAIGSASITGALAAYTDRKPPVAGP
jgi:hypothetical protein